MMKHKTDTMTLNPIKWIKRCIERAELGRKEQRESEERFWQTVIQHKQERIAKRDKEMQSGKCALNNMHYCTDRCTHYRKGVVHEEHDVYGRPEIKITMPACRLWRLEESHEPDS